MAAKTVIIFRPTTVPMTAASLNPQSLPGATHLSSPPSVRTWSSPAAIVAAILLVCVLAARDLQGFVGPRKLKP